MPVSTPSESRARQLLGKGASPEEVMRVTGLSKGAVLTLARTIKIHPAKPTPDFVGDATAVTQSREAQAPVREPEQAKPRGSKREAVKDWTEDDFSDFIKFWNETPVREKACEAYQIDVEALDYVLFTLKRGGVMLRKPQKIALNFDKLRQVAEASLSDEAKAAIRERSERAKARMKELRASGKMIGRRKAAK